MIAIKTYFPDGSSRAIWSKPLAKTHRQHRVLPVRGSHIIAITEGPRAGLFQVDFTPMAYLTNNPTFAVCLTETFESHEEAAAAEHQWLLQNWVLCPMRRERD